MPKKIVNYAANDAIQDSFWLMTGDLLTTLLLTPIHYMRVQNWDPDPTHILQVRDGALSNVWTDLVSTDEVNYVDLTESILGHRLQFRGKNGMAVNNIRLIYLPMSAAQAAEAAAGAKK